MCISHFIEMPLCVDFAQMLSGGGVDLNPVGRGLGRGGTVVRAQDCQYR